MMKYTINHPWKFEHWFIAFLGNFFQAIMRVLTETVFYAILLVQESVLDVLIIFLVVSIIAQLDSIFFSTLHENPISRLITQGETTICGKVCKLDDIIKIETTTSF